MLKKDLYLQIYRRFCKEHNLRMKRDAVDDIVSGMRLIFGIGNVYRFGNLLHCSHIEGKEGGVKICFAGYPHIS
mgnify:CR=1 FL=1